MPDIPQLGGHRSGHRSAVAEALGSALRDAVGARDWRLVDLGGGTGGFAVPLAVEGHQITVVDPSPDALASLERRAAEAGVSERVRGILGDAAELSSLVEPGAADAVLCHGVLEVVDDPAEALTAIAGVLRPGGVLSLLVQQRHAMVAARALSGRFVEARTALADPDGRWGSADPVPRRFDESRVRDLLEATGLSIGAVHGIRIFSDLVASSYVDTDPAAARELAALELSAGVDPTFRPLAAQLHVLATR